MEINDYLEHHGVKGMKWGVRKSRVSTSGGSKKSKKKSSILESFKKKRLSRVRAKNAAKRQKEQIKKVTKANTEARKKSVKSMTNEELDRNIARLQKEKLYKDLSRSTRKTGQTFVMDVLKTAGKAVAIEATKNVLAYTINTASGKKLAKTSILSKEQENTIAEAKARQKKKKDAA